MVTSANARTSAAVDVGDLLQKTSRTFALSIPLLPEPTRSSVGLAYLLFRIADTLEDAEWWDRQYKARALREFSRLIEGADAAQASCLARAWVENPPLSHAGYQELLAASPEVFQLYWDLPGSTRDILRRHLLVTSEGMARSVERCDEEGVLALRDLEDLREYCYIVAGVVGEMLTELYPLAEPGLAPVMPFLRERAAAFGRGLQLVNILKDAGADRTVGRCFLPPRVPLAEVFALARQDLEAATEYVNALQAAGATPGLVRFNALLVVLARATVDRVEGQGSGAKLTRPEVFTLLERMHAAVEAGAPPVVSL